MRRRIRVNPKTNLASIPKQLVEDGLSGDVDAYANAVTVTLVKPGALLIDVRDSLRTVLQDVELRMRVEGRTKPLIHEEKQAAEPKITNWADEMKSKLVKLTENKGG